MTLALLSFFIFISSACLSNSGVVKAAEITSNYSLTPFVIFLTLMHSILMGCVMYIFASLLRLSKQLLIYSNNINIAIVIRLLKWDKK